MHGEMKNNSLDGIVESTLNNLLEQWENEGLSDAQIIQKLEKCDFQGLYERLMRTAKKDTFAFYKDHMFDIADDEKKKTGEFVARLEQSWGKCFAASQTMYTIAVESAEEYSKYVSDKADDENIKDKQYTMLVLQHIHGRACQEFLEILHMLRLGFADGAYARWRSMYELCCNAKFIVTYGEPIAKSYYEQSESEDHKYTWAAGVKCNNGKKLDNRPTFNDIQDNCDIDGAWKKQYRLACFVNHGSPQGTFKRLANGPGSNCIPVGHSNYGIAMPAIQSAISLLWISHLFLTLFPTAEYTVRVMLMKDWLDFLHEEYTETEKRLFGKLMSQEYKE